MNFNLTNILGTITAICTMLTGIMAQLFGCTAADGAITGTCTSTMFSPKYMLWISIAFGIITLVSKAIRPGGPLRGLFGTTAVVVSEDSKHSVAGTVTPAQVATP